MYRHVLPHALVFGALASLSLVCSPMSARAQTDASPPATAQVPVSPLSDTIPTAPPAAATPPPTSVLPAPDAPPAVPIAASQPAITTPAFTGPPPVLLYRAAPTAAGTHNGVAFWLRGDKSGGAIRVLIFASGGHAADPLPIPGSGRDPQPLWPAWVSRPVAVDFTGWSRIVLGPKDFAFRPSPSESALPAPDFSTADAVGFASNKLMGTLYVDDLVWANLDAQDQASGESAIIDDFHQGDVAAWRTKGTPESVQGFIYGVSTQPMFVKDAQVSLKLDYSPAAQLRANRQASVAQALRVSKTPYLVSVPLSPFERELPDTLPTSTELTSRISVFACPEQIQPASFCVYAAKPMTNVIVQAKTDLFMLTSRIPKTSVDIRVVKVWPRLGTGVYRDPDAAGPTPELLIKDDRATLSASGATLPDVRLTGDPITNIPAFTQKQFWITVRVPRDTKPGDYTGQIAVSGLGFKPFSVTLDVNVLPLRLLSPAKQYTIGLRSRLAPPPATLPASDGLCLYTDYVSRQQLAAQIADIVDHGFRYLTLSDQDPTLTDEIAAATSSNVGMPLIYTGLSSDDPMTAAEAVEKDAASGHTVSFNYLIPPGPHQADTVVAFKKAGLTTVAFVPDQATFDTLKDNLDVPIYSVDEAYSQYLLQHNGQRTSDKRDWWVWPAGQIDPQANRLYAGFLLWHCNMYGAYVSDYETSYGTNPYDDSDPGAPPIYSAVRPAMMTYPTSDGVIDTIQWEAVREGITDVRYLTTFYTALRECKDAHIAKAMVAKDEADVTRFVGKPFWLMTDPDYQKGRLMIATEAVQLRQTVDLYNKKLLMPTPVIKGNQKLAAKKGVQAGIKP